MKTIKVSEATGPALAWLVATCQGYVEQGVYGTPEFRDSEVYLRYCDAVLNSCYSPTTDWAQAGPLLNQHKISRTIDHSGLWIAYAGYNLNDEQRHMQCDRSELVAGLRCLVALNLGDTVEVPDELL